MSFPGAHSRYELQVARLADIPIRVSAWYLVIAWIATARAGSIQGGLVGLGVFTLSVLAHELGHGFAARHHRLRPSILLHGFGGWCEHTAPRTLDQALVVVAAGPAVTVAIAVLARIGMAVVPSEVLPWWGPWALASLWQLNAFLAVLNLLPILPLDGGAIALNLLSRRGRRNAQQQIRWIGAVAGGLGAVVALFAFGELFAAVLLALLAYENVAALGKAPTLEVLTVDRAASGTSARTGRAPAAGGVWLPAPVVAWTAAVVGGLGLVLTLLPRSTMRVAVDGASLDAWALSQGELWRLVTWALLGPPGDAAQIGFALAVLLAMGSLVERRLGKGPTAVLLLLGWAAATGAGWVCTGVDPTTADSLQGFAAPAFAVVAAWGALAPPYRLRELLPVNATAQPWLFALLLWGFAVARALPDHAWSWLAALTAAGVAGLVWTGWRVPRVAPWRPLVVAWRLRFPPHVDLGPPPDRRR